MTKLLSVLRGLVLLVARIGLGAVLIGHAWQRYQQGIGGADGQAAYFTQFGLPHGEVVAWIVIGAEAVAGLMLIVGFITPLFALVALADQVFLIAYTNWYKSWPLLQTDRSYNGGWEYEAILGLLALVFVVHGGGSAALDRLFRRTKESGAAEEDEPADDPSARSLTYSA